MLSLDPIIIFINPGKTFINGEPKWHPSWRRFVRWFFYISKEAIITEILYSPIKLDNRGSTVPRDSVNWNFTRG